MILREQSGVPLSISGLSVAYRSDPVLWNLHWSARAGSMTAIVGPNGAGKTTLLNAALELVPRLSGEVRFWGQPLSAVRERIAFVPQRESIDWDFPVTAEDVVRMGATRGASWWIPSFARRLSPSARDESKRAAEALDQVQMADFRSRPIGELSGGQQQRVFLARALAQDADLILLDEPFAGVDAGTEAVLTGALRELTRQGKTVIAVHHDLSTVPEYFDDALILNVRKISEGPVAEAFTSEALDKAYGGRLDTGAAARVPALA